jgi:hypothetical protein
MQKRYAWILMKPRVSTGRGRMLVGRRRAGCLMQRGMHRSCPRTGAGLAHTKRRPRGTGEAPGPVC